MALLARLKDDMTVRESGTATQGVYCSYGGGKCGGQLAYVRQLPLQNGGLLRTLIMMPGWSPSPEHDGAWCVIKNRANHMRRVQRAFDQGHITREEYDRLMKPQWRRPYKPTWAAEGSDLREKGFQPGDIPSFVRSLEDPSYRPIRAVCWRCRRVNTLDADALGVNDPSQVPTRRTKT